MVPKPSLSQWLERGTPHFHGILALPAQVRSVQTVGGVLWYLQNLNYPFSVRFSTIYHISMSSSFIPKLHHPPGNFIAPPAPQVCEVSRLGSPWARRHHPWPCAAKPTCARPAARHGNGRRLSRVLGAHEHPEWETMQGPTLALLLCLGKVLGECWWSGWVMCFVKESHGIHKEVEEWKYAVDVK